MGGGDRAEENAGSDAASANAAPNQSSSLEIAPEELLLPLRWLEGTFELNEAHERFPHARPDRLPVAQGGRFRLDEAGRTALVQNAGGWSSYQSGGFRLSWLAGEEIEFRHSDVWLDGEQPQLTLTLNDESVEGGRKLHMTRWEDDHARFFRDFCEVAERDEVRDVILPMLPERADWASSQFAEGPVHLDFRNRGIRIPDYVWPKFPFPRELYLILSAPLTVSCAREHTQKTLEPGEFECKFRGYSYQASDPEPVAEFSQIELWPLDTACYDVYVSDDWIFDAAARGEIELAIGAERWWKF